MLSNLLFPTPGRSPARVAHRVEILVPVYPAEQIVVVSNGARKLNLCCCSSGRVLQPDEIRLKFISTVLQLECSHFSRQHTLYLNCTITLL